MPAPHPSPPRFGAFRHRAVTAVIIATSLGLPTFAPRHSTAQNVVVSGGAVQANVLPATYDSLEVYGTDGLGNSSTYDADAALTLAGNLIVHDLGVLNANADITAAGFAAVHSGGRITLADGVFKARGISLQGAGSLTQSGGAFVTTDVFLSGGATMTYGANDRIDGGFVNISSGASMTAERDLGIMALSLTSGGQLLRSTATIEAYCFMVDDASLDLLDGDIFTSNNWWSHVGNGGVVNIAGGVTTGNISSHGINADGRHSTMTVGGDMTVNGEWQSWGGGIVDLHAGTVTSNSVALWGSGALTQTGGHYRTGTMWMFDGVQVTYGEGDSITNAVVMQTGSRLILDQNLTLSNWLSLSNGASIDRTTQTISALGFSVSDTTLDLTAGDSFTPPYSWWTSSVAYGAVVNAAAGVVLPGVDVYGTNGAGDRATLTIAGDVTATGDVYASWGGRINLDAGTLDATGRSLFFSGEGSVNQNGGHYAAAYVAIANGAMLAYGLGDSVDSLSIDGEGSVVEELAPLSLTTLSVSNGGSLRLASFTGTGAVLHWGLRMAGNDVSYLSALISSGLLTGGGAMLTAFFDAGSNASYVTMSLTSASVPEIDPASARIVVAVLLGGFGILERRSRRRATATVPA